MTAPRAADIILASAGAFSFLRSRALHYKIRKHWINSYLVASQRIIDIPNRVCPSDCIWAWCKCIRSQGKLNFYRFAQLCITFSELFIIISRFYCVHECHRTSDVHLRCINSAKIQAIILSRFYYDISIVSTCLRIEFLRMKRQYISKIMFPTSAILEKMTKTPSLRKYQIKLAWPNAMPHRFPVFKAHWMQTRLERSSISCPFGMLHHSWNIGSWVHQGSRRKRN